MEENYIYLLSSDSYLESTILDYYATNEDDLISILSLYMDDLFGFEVIKDSVKFIKKTETFGFIKFDYIDYDDEVENCSYCYRKIRK